MINYIGETEKNLRSILDKAASSTAVLSYDEVDELFGTRSESQDACGRDAKDRKSYVLHRITDQDIIMLIEVKAKNDQSGQISGPIQFSKSDMRPKACSDR